MNYTTELKYLSYGYCADKISFPIQIKERHITQDTNTILIHGTGHELNMFMFSERDDIVVSIPLKKWVTTSPYTVQFSGNNNGLISVGRFEEALPVKNKAEFDVVKARIKTIDVKPSEV